METETYLYPYSAGEAKDRGELALWRASHQANIACKKAIERAIRNHHHGAFLEENCLQSVLQNFGYKRTAWGAGQYRPAVRRGQPNQWSEPELGKSDIYSPGQAEHHGIYRDGASSGGG